MNIEKFYPEVIAPSTTRVSERKRNKSQIERSFFKKVFKPKAQNNLCDKLNNAKYCEDLENKAKDIPYEQAASSLFVQISPTRLQAKTIHAYRVKKIKRMLKHQTAPQEALQLLFSGNLKLTTNSSQKNLISEKSLVAQSRARGPAGRFVGEREEGKYLYEYSTVDMRDNSKSVVYSKDPTCDSIEQKHKSINCCPFTLFCESSEEESESNYPNNQSSCFYGSELIYQPVEQNAAIRSFNQFNEIDKVEKQEDIPVFVEMDTITSSHKITEEDFSDAEWEFICRRKDSNYNQTLPFNLSVQDEEEELFSIEDIFSA